VWPVVATISESVNPTKRRTPKEAIVRFTVIQM
jgi:hypothetical protein